MKKKIMAGIVALAMVSAMGLAACSGSSNTNNAANTNNTANTAATANANTNNTTNANANATAAANTNATNTASTYIGEEAAKTAALAHAGFAAGDVTELTAHLDTDDATVHYDVDFKNGGKEYDYDIDAATGNVLNYKTEVDD